MDPLAQALIERFKTARATLGMSQKTASKILGVSQKQVSDYEAGKPAPEEQQVLLLEGRVAGQRAALEAFSPSSRAATLEMVGGTPKLVNDDAFSAFIADYVGRWDQWNQMYTGTGKCQFFFFGPEHLPVFSNSRFQELWTANLRKQVDYNLIWLLDGSSAEEMKEAFWTLKGIESAAVADGAPSDAISKVHVWGFMMTSEAAADEKRLLYKRFKSSTVLRIEPLVDLNERQVPFRSEWLRAIRIGGLAPVMVARIDIDIVDEDVPNDAVPPPSFSARRESNVSLKPRGPRETGWLFLDQSETRKIVEDLNKMTNGDGRSATSES